MASLSCVSASLHRVTTPRDRRTGPRVNHGRGISAAPRGGAHTTEDGDASTSTTSDLETQHLFITSTGGFMESLLSSHPPILERILRLQPSFDGVIRSFEPVIVKAEVQGVSSGLAGQASAAIPPPIRAARAHRIPTDQEIQEAVGFQGRAGVKAEPAHPQQRCAHQDAFRTAVC